MKRSQAFALVGSGQLAGMGLGTLGRLSWEGIGLALALVSIFMFLFWKKKPIKRALTFILFLLLGLSYTTYWSQGALSNVPFKRKVNLKAEIIECQQALRNHHCLLKTLRPLSTRLTVTLNSSLKPGEAILITGVIHPLPDELHYLRGDGVTGRLEGPIYHSIPSPSFSLRRSLFNVRSAAEQQLIRVLAEPAATLVTGLLFGSRQQFSDSFMDSLKKTNTLHIVAVSGFNITILVEFLRRLLTRLPRGILFACIGIAITLFVLMIGAPPSAVRAGIMGFLLMFGTLIGRKAYPFSLIIFTALIMTIPNPYLLRYDIGFQLSFLAFAGLVGLAPLFERKLTLVPTPLRGLLAATLGASLATAPRLIPLSGEISLIGPLINLLVLPFIPLVMLLGSVVLGLAFLFPSAAAVVGFLLYLPSRWIVKAIEEGGAFYLATVHWSWGLALLIIFVLFYLTRRRRASLH